MSIEHHLADVVERTVRRVVREELKVQRTAPVRREYLSLGDATTFASVSKNTIRRWIDDGDLPVCKHGGVVRIRRADLVALLAPDLGTTSGVETSSRALHILDRKRNR